VPRKLAALKDRMEFGPPKSEAGVRTVALSKAAVDAHRRRSMRAALIYQHAISERDREIAKGMDRRIAKAAEKGSGKKSLAEGRSEEDREGRRSDGPAPATGP
jgi:hypothetical protein